MVKIYVLGRMMRVWGLGKHLAIHISSSEPTRTEVPGGQRPSDLKCGLGVPRLPNHVKLSMHFISLRVSPP